MRGMIYPDGIRISYLPANRAWAVLWHDSMLRIFNLKADARDYAESLLARS